MSKAHSRRQIIRWIRWVLVAHACNPSYSGAEIRRTVVRSQSRQIVLQTLSQKKPSQKWLGVVAEGVCPEFNTQYQKKRRRRRRQVIAPE
jgi:hypothetical protein